MADYYYEARRPDGSKISGCRTAGSEDAVASQLFAQGYTPVKIEPGQRQTLSLTQTIGHWLRRSHIPLEEKLMFCQQMYTMHKSGIPLISGLARIADTSSNPLMAQILRQVIDQLSAGTTLSDSLALHPKTFTPLFVNVVRAGESSGRMDLAFSRLSEYLIQEEVTIKRFKSALRYPTIVLLAMVVAILVINVLVVPAFAKMFAQFHAQLPLATRLLIGSSNFIIGYWYLLLLAFAGIVFGLRYAVSTKKGLYQWHRLLMRIKIIGPIVRRILLVRFARTFALVSQAGVSVNDGLLLVSKTLGNTWMQKRIEAMHHAIVRGESITQAAANTHLFPPLVIQMFAVGEETGNLDEMLDNVAEFYERQVDYDLDKLGDTIEPILLITMGAMVLILALGVFLPMWDMVQFAKI